MESEGTLSKGTIHIGKESCYFVKRIDIDDFAEFFNNDIVIDDDVSVFIMQNHRCKLQLDSGLHDFTSETEDQASIKSLILYASGSLLVLDSHPLSIPFHFEGKDIHTYDKTPIYSTGILHVGLSSSLIFCEQYLVDDEFVISDEIKQDILHKAETCFCELFRVYNSDMLSSPEEQQEYANYFSSELNRLLNRNGLTVLDIAEFNISLIGSTLDEDLFEDELSEDETDTDTISCITSPEEGKYAEYLRKSNYERALLEKSLHNPGMTDIELIESMISENVCSVPIKALISILDEGSNTTVRKTAITELYRRSIIVTASDLEKIAKNDSTVAGQIIAYSLNLQTIDGLLTEIENNREKLNMDLIRLYGAEINKIWAILEGRQ